MTKKDLLIRTILVVRDGHTQIVEGLNEILAALAPEEAAPGPVSVTGIPKIDLAELATSGWTSYKTKQPAEVHEAAWIKNPVYFTKFEAPQAIYELVKALKKAKDHQLQLGDMDYFFSGEEKFIARRPVKKESAK
jgi:hypothetical protein